MRKRLVGLGRAGVMLAFLGALSSVPARVHGLDDGQALTPPMGWNSWNTFRMKIDEGLVKGVVDAMVESGMRDAGYRYINLDDGWQRLERDASGNVVVDATKFPSGMKALGDYIHERGFKFGIYTCVGVKTCGGVAGSYGHEEQDARQYAEWGVDYVKNDFCFTHPRCIKDPTCLHTNGPTATTVEHEPFYKRWHAAIAKAGRPMILSICQWGSGDAKPWLWGARYGHLWRRTGDIKERWESWTGILDQQVGLEPYNGPGHWNDPDMLVAGMEGMSPQESRAHLSLWCLLSAPLIAGHDPRGMTRGTIETLTNPEVLAIDQDPLGRQGTRILKRGDLEVWAKPLKDEAWAVVLFNRGGSAADITLFWEDLRLAPTTAMQVRDLWDRKDRGTHTRSYSASVPYHGVVMVTLTPAQGEGGALPAGFSRTDVGWAWAPGRSTWASGSFLLRAAGEGTGEEGDELHFAYRPVALAGDGEWIAKVEAMNEQNRNSKAGIMLRQDLTPDAPYALIAVTPGRNAATFERRLRRGERAQNDYGGGKPPYWLKLTRKGDMVSGAISLDGAQWTPLGHDRLALRGGAFIGLALTGTDIYHRGEATITNVSFE